MLSNINELVRNSNRLQDVIAKVVDLVTRLLNSDMAGVMLYNQETDELVLQKPAFGLADDDIINSYRVPLKGGGNAVTVYTTGEPYITSDSRSDSRFLQQFVLITGARGTITVPLKVENRRIGVLHVNNKRNGEFTQQDLEVLTFLASHVAMFIENALLFERERKQAEELAQLNLKLQNHQQGLEKLIYDHSLLTRQVLNEEGIPALVKTLAVSLQVPVMVEDRYFNLITASYPGEAQISSGELLKAQGKLGRIKHGKSVKSDLYINNGKEQFRLVAPIGDNHLIMGYLSIEVDKHVNIDSAMKLTFEQGAMALALEMMKGRIKNEVAVRHRGQFLDDLFSGEKKKLEHILYRADLLHYDLGKKSRVAVIILKSFEGQDYTLGIDLRPLITAIQNSFPGSLAVAKRNRLELLFPFASGISREDLTDKLNAACRWGRQFYPGTNISIGVGCECQDLKDYPKSYRQSQKALEIGEALECAYDVIFYDQLGAYSLLFEINDLTMLREFVEDRIGPLLNYDQKKNSSLVVTLEKYLKSRGSLKEAANLLYVHVATVKYRLSRIQELIPLDLRKTENHFDLQLALYSLRILEKSSSAINPTVSSSRSTKALPKTRQNAYA